MGKKYKQDFPNNTIVVYNINEPRYDGRPFFYGKRYLYLGDVTQMPGHGIFVDEHTHLTYFGYHTDSFRLPVKDVEI